MNDIINATHINPIEKVGVYLVMHRYGNSYWDVSSSYITLEEAQSNLTNKFATAYQIVYVADLPIRIES